MTIFHAIFKNFDSHFELPPPIENHTLVCSVKKCYKNGLKEVDLLGEGVYFSLYTLYKIILQNTYCTVDQKSKLIKNKGSCAGNSHAYRKATGGNLQIYNAQ